jgi:hypothetical protein
MYGEEMVRKTLDGNKRQYAALLVSEGYSDGEICRQLDIEPHLLRAAKVNPNFPKQVEETRGIHEDGTGWQRGTLTVGRLITP